MKLKRILLVIAGVGMLFSNGIFVTAQETESDERVIQVAIPDENGELRYYTGEEAQKRYDQLEKQTEEKQDEDSTDEVILDDAGIEWDISEDSDVFVCWGGAGNADQCSKIFLLNTDTNVIQEISDQYLKFERIEITQKNHYVIFGLKNGKAEDLSDGLLYEVHKLVK